MHMIQPLLFLSALTMTSPEYLTAALHQGPAETERAGIMQFSGMSNKQVQVEPGYLRFYDECVFAGIRTPTAPQLS